MRFGLRIFGCMAALTVFVLLYVHGQVSLFEVSYNIDTKKEALARNSEEYRRLRYEVDQLKAPRILETKIKEFGLELAAPDTVQIVKIPDISLLNAPVMANVAAQPVPDGLMNILGRWVKVAQAKTSE